jgi:hypothetical protein
VAGDRGEVGEPCLVHDREPGRDRKAHSADKQPLDLLQLVPLQHPADRRLRPQGFGHHRQQAQAACLASVFDREHRKRVGPRRTARFRQHSSVVQQVLRVSCCGRRTFGQNECPRILDGRPAIG